LIDLNNEIVNVINPEIVTLAKVGWLIIGY
jgi:hypothetical protein